MLKRSICNPFFLFVSTWAFLLFLININARVGLIYFYELTDVLYWSLTSFAVAWGLGSAAAYVFAPSLIRYLRQINFYSIDGYKSKVILSFLLFLYLFFRLLDVFKTTGVVSIAPGNIEAYRYAVTEMGVMPSYVFINILNPILFALPAIVFHLSRCDAVAGFRVRFFFFLIYIFFVYLSSARSAAFVSLLVLFFVMAYSNVRAFYLFTLPFLMFLIFGVIGYFVGKSGFGYFFIYLFAPIHAFDAILSGAADLSYPLLSFRPFHGVLHQLGVLDGVFHLLDYIETPLPTNVYTVFGVYYNDFGFFGVMLFMFVFSFWSTVVHLAAIRLSSFRLILLSSFYLSFIVLGVFYDYYTSSMFSFLAPVIIFFFIPIKYSKN